MQRIFPSFTASARSLAQYMAAVLFAATMVMAASDPGLAAQDSPTAGRKIQAKRGGIPSQGRAGFPVSRAATLTAPQGVMPPVASVWQPLMDRLARDGMDSAYLARLFGRMGDSYSHVPMGTKISELFAITFIPRPPRPQKAAPRNTPPQVYRNLVTPRTIDLCRRYLLQHAVAFAAMEARYGVPKEIVAGLLMVETRLGTYLGSNSSFWSLACMAAAVSPEHVAPTLAGLPLPMTPEREIWLRRILRERSDWAYRELLVLVRHAQENGVDPLQMPGSIYGAIGICQFMPSNLPKFAVDGNGDGKVDLFDPADAIASVGNYLKRNGWQNTDRESRHAALKRYNKSNIYANTILAIASGIEAARAPQTTGNKSAVTNGKGKQTTRTGNRKVSPRKTTSAAPAPGRG